MTEPYKKDLDKEKNKRNGNSVSITSQSSSSPSKDKRKAIENVLLWQGSGSLGVLVVGYSRHSQEEASRDPVSIIPIQMKVGSRVE